MQTPAWHAHEILAALQTRHAGILDSALERAEKDYWNFSRKTTFEEEQAEVVLSVASSLRLSRSLALMSASVVLLKTVAAQH